MWRYGHFDIAVGADGQPVELGAGAMATTYRATDSVLHSAVALKVIDQKVAEHPTARARFLREARAAAKLHHPNVASVSHYGEQNGECYYVMELVDGETLEARVRREGPLPPALALEIGVQVARALAAAEACGVVHRDLKPSNIMLTTPQGEKTGGGASTVVKVIDWGLAKAVTAESALGTDHTHGGFVGTPAFASPEQFSRAEDRRVDHRSDIYSLGVTLWYLLCGRTPFSGTTLEEIRARQVEHPIPLAQLTAARVPTRIVTLLKSMMAADPAARPQSARELLDRLRACQQYFPAADTPTQTRFVRDRRFMLMLLLLLVAVAFTVGTTWRHFKPAHLPSELSVAVLPFENTSRDPDGAFFGASIQREIAAGLAQVSRLKVIGQDSVRAYLPGKRDLPAIGAALGANHLVEGSVQRDGERIRLHVALVDARTARPVWTKDFDRSRAETFAVESEVTAEVADRLGATPSAAEATAINRAPTRNLAAYDLLLRAKEGVQIGFTPDSLKQLLQRRFDLLNEAVKLDPNFVAAYCVLAGLHDDYAHYVQDATPEERAVDHRSLAEAALLQAQRLQPDSGLVHLATAKHLISSLRNSEQARIELDLARRTLPNHPLVERYAGMVARVEGRWDEALRAYEKVVALEPRQPGGFLELSTTYGYLRDYVNQDRALVTMTALSPSGSNPEIPMLRAMGDIEGRADLGPLRIALQELRDEEEPSGLLRSYYWLILSVLENDPDEVRRALLAYPTEDIALANFAYPKAWFEALAARMRKDETAAQTAFAAARVRVAKTVEADPQDERNLLLLAMIDAGLGRKEDAVREARRACATTPKDMVLFNAPSNRCCLAVVYAWTGQADLALAELDDLVAHPAGDNMPKQPTYGDLKLNPLWEPLRADPRFAAITQRLAPTDPSP